MGKKGTRSTRGVGELYDQPKTVQVIVLLTPDGAALLNAKALEKKLSRSELIERFARGTL
jgi:hypothetical protein